MKVQVIILDNPQRVALAVALDEDVARRLQGDRGLPQPQGAGAEEGPDDLGSFGVKFYLPGEEG